MKLLRNKATSKKVNFKAFLKLSIPNLQLIKGGSSENPPEEQEDPHAN